MLRLNVVLLFVLFKVLFISAHRDDDRLIVDTPLGKIRGSIITSRLGNDIYSFRSVRYAKAPVGELRFQPPVPVEKWNDVYDATQPGPVCPQFFNRENSSEDCLMLNVYANKLPSVNSPIRRPVLVFLHPGAFYVFSAASYFHGPEYLLDEDIVLVTANYRLASLGFLSTGTKEAPGNNGFKDQVAVLRWVRDNIEAFGGNPDDVTLGGYSAGGLSTTLHLVSPMSRGLFHKAFAMGATGLGIYTVEADQLGYAKKQAQLLNCPDDTPANIIECLKTKSAQEIADTLQGFREIGTSDPGLIWNVVIEPDFGQERFITEHPITSALKGNIAKVPTMIGRTEIEFGFVSYYAIMSQTYLDLLSNEPLRVLPIIFGYERNSKKSNDISRGLYEFYFGDGKVENTSREGIDLLFRDATGFAMDRTVKLISEKNTKNTYYYEFTYGGRYSYFYLPNTTQAIGAVHHDDLQYVFYMANLFPRINRGDPEWKTVDKMVKIWTDFVKTGNPTPEKSPLLNNVKWPVYEKNGAKYMDIGDKMVIRDHLDVDRLSIWENLFPLSDYL